MSYRICIVFALAFFDATFSIESAPDPKSLIVPCNLGDIECLKKSTELFLSKTHKGIPAYDILPLDPFVIPSLDLPSPSKRFLNRNVTVTGLAQQSLHNFEMDLKTGSVILTTSVDLNMAGNTTLVHDNSNTEGSFSSRGRVLGAAHYSYTLKKDDKGVEHFVVGPETISCEIVDAPAFVFTSQLAGVCNDASCPEDKKLLWHKNVCEMVKTAYKSVVHNIRAIAKVLPSTAFFKNLHKN